MDVQVEVNEVKKVGDGWVGVGPVVDQQTSHLSKVWVAFRLDETHAAQIRDAILQGAPLRHAVVASEILETRIAG